MNGNAEDGVSRIDYRFRESRMSVHSMSQLLGSEFALERDARFCNHLGHARAYGMHAENLVVFRVAYNLDVAFVISEDLRFGVGQKRELPDLDFVAAFFRLLLRKADAGDLRVAIGAARNAIVVDRFRMTACYMFDCDDSFRRGHVSKQWGRNAIAYSVDFRRRSAHILIDDDVSAFEFDVDAFKTDAVSDRPSPDCDEKEFRFDLGDLSALDVLGRNFNAVVIDLVRLKTGSDERFDAALSE